MRLWSIHPKYLDQKGLVALWRETLLAQNVLAGNTKGYKNHPQLIRFKTHSSPIPAIGFYLYEIYIEAKKRDYSFNKDKIIRIEENTEIINTTIGQIQYEFKHLKNKLIKRDILKFKEIEEIENIEVHPIFKVKEGNIESWEIIN